MARDWESTFKSWTAPSSNTEQQKQDNAERMIRAAIREHEPLAQRSIRVFPQGSYRNNTNVRQESDVDICVVCDDTFFFDLPNTAGLDRTDFGLSPATYLYGDFRNEVEDALVAKFGCKSVHRGNKAFDIKENTYRVDADVVACFEHRRYTGKVKSDGKPHYHIGTEFRPDAGDRIINWPNQHYDGGVAKNKATGMNFKPLTRVIKRLRNEMNENGIAAAGPVPSFFIECLVYNVPDEGFRHDSYKGDVQYILAHIFNGTIGDEKCSEWVEVSGFKWLFRSGQNWTRKQAHAFADAAWEYVGFE